MRLPESSADSKQDSLRVLEETGTPAPSYPTLNRGLPAWAEEPWQQGLSKACPYTPGWAQRRLALYDLSTLYHHRRPRSRQTSATPSHSSSNPASTH